MEPRRHTHHQTRSAPNLAKHLSQHLSPTVRHASLILRTLAAILVVALTRIGHLVGDPVVRRARRLRTVDGNAVAERVGASIGSWRFIGAQAALMTLWVLVNTIGPLRLRFDSYPFVFLNLAMSAEAAFTGPILLIAAVVSAIRDHTQADRVQALAERVDDLVEGMATLLKADHEEHGRQLAILAARTGDDSADGNLLTSMRDEIAALREQLSAKATVRAAKKQADTPAA